MPPRDLALALVVVIVWGLNFVAIKWAVTDFPPLLLTALRYIAAALPAVLFIRPPKVKLSILVAYALFVGVGQFGLIFSAIHMGMPAGLASLVVQTQAFFTMGLAVGLIGEGISRGQLAGAAIACGGVAVIALERFEGTAWLPLVMVLGAALSWACSNIVVKKAGRIDMFAFVVWSALVPPLPMLALSGLVEGPAAIGAALAGAGPLAWGSLAFIAYLSTILAYGGWSALLSRHPASVVAPFSLLVPVTGMGSAMLILGERVTGLEIAGSVLIFVGLLLNVAGGRSVNRNAAEV